MADEIRLDDFDQELDLECMGREELLACLKQVRAQIDRLDEEEPAEMEGEGYEAWGDRHEALEDLADEIQDRLEELEAYGD
jgi:hypothetical protein